MFASKTKAEELINYLRTQLNVPQGDISYIYHDTNTDARPMETTTIVTSRSAPAEGAATGAVVGGSIGALAGLATIAGIIPVIGPIFAAGPLLAVLGISAGAVGTVAAGGLTGVIAGGIIGTLVNLGATESQAQVYEERLIAGDVLVAVYADTVYDIERALALHGATSIAVLKQPHSP
jgi:hypothetical protein